MRRFVRQLLWGICLSGTWTSIADETPVTLSPRISQEQLVLYGEKDGHCFDARGVVLLGGMSDLFRPPPEFCLFSDRRHDPEKGIGYPETSILESWELPNAERYPLQLRDMNDPSISGVTVIGLQSGDLPWRVLKAMWDGDALHVKDCRGRARVTDVYWENVEDGFGPMEGLTSWSLERAWMKDIRDDAIENDELVPGEIADCLIDGCFVFVSQRSESRQRASEPLKVRDCVVRVKAQPHDGEPQKAWRNKQIMMRDDGIGRAPGMIFKWAGSAGEVEVKRCVFCVEEVSVNGFDDMRFPPGSYEEVTLVWLGEGNYPAPLPIGVTVTDDPTVWEKAKQAWLDRAPKDHPGWARPDLELPAE